MRKYKRESAMNEFEDIWNNLERLKQMKLTEQEYRLLKFLEKIGNTGIEKYINCDDDDERESIEDQIAYHAIIRDSNPDAWAALYFKSIERTYQIKFWQEQTQLHYFEQSRDMFLGILWFDMYREQANDALTLEMAKKHADEVILRKMEHKRVFTIQGNLDLKKAEKMADALFNLALFNRTADINSTPLTERSADNNRWDLKYEITEVFP